MLNDYEKLAALAKIDPQAFIGNPVNSYLLTKKLTKDFDEFKEKISLSQASSKNLIKI